MAAILSCSQCEAPLPVAVLGGLLDQCPSCRRWLKVVAFPALLRDAKKGSFGERAMVEGDSTCFFHSDKKATVVCEGCGRFLCSLCDIEMDGEHVCSACLEAGRGKIGEKIIAERVLYEDMAWGLALLGLLIGPPGVIPAVGAIFVSLRHWRKPQKFGARGKTKKVGAIVLSLGVIGLWGTLITAMLL